MRWGESRTVKLKSIIAPGNAPERQAQPHVQELARDIRELGNEPIHPLSVMKVRGGWKLIAGRDRYSALALNGSKTAPVRVIEEASAQELHDLEVSENLHRRVDDRDKLIAERLRQVTARVVAERANPGQKTKDRPSKPGPAKAPETEARERVAAQLGTTPEAVRSASRRVEREEAPAGNRDTAQAARPAPPIDPFEKVGRLLRQALDALDGLDSEKATRVRDATQGAIDEVADKFGPAFDTPEWHRENAAMHAKGDGGPCGCQSCNVVRRERGEPEVDLSVKPAKQLHGAEDKPRHIPPIKAGVTYIVGDNGDVVEQDIDRHIARAAVAVAKPKKGGIVIDGMQMSVEEAERFAVTKAPAAHVAAVLADLPPSEVDDGAEEDIDL